METKNHDGWLDLDTIKDAHEKRPEFKMNEDGWLDIPRDRTGDFLRTEELKCVYTDEEMECIAEEMQPFGDTYISLFSFSECIIHDLRYGLVTLTY